MSGVMLKVITIPMTAVIMSSPSVTVEGNSDGDVGGEGECVRVGVRVRSERGVGGKGEDMMVEGGV